MDRDDERRDETGAEYEPPKAEDLSTEAQPSSTAAGISNVPK
jgi:hypothetical protein